MSCSAKRIALPVRRGMLIGMIAVASIAWGTGCAPKSPASAGTASGDDSGKSSPLNTDPCAGALHDLSGALLLYYFHYQRLPDSLDELRRLPGVDQPLVLACPKSGVSYIYDPTGIYWPERAMRVIVYDPDNAHGSFRWAITVQEPQPGQPLVTRVVALPESFFLVRRAQPGR